MSKKIAPVFDAFLGVEFTPRTSNHYEFNDGKPVAPPVNTPRLSLRERVNRLLAGGADLSQGIYDDDDAADWEDDDSEPLTPSEQAYLKAEETVEMLRASQAQQPPASPLPSAAATPPADPPAEGPGAAPKPGA